MQDWPNNTHNICRRCSSYQEIIRQLWRILKPVPKLRRQAIQLGIESIAHDPKNVYPCLCVCPIIVLLAFSDTQESIHELGQSHIAGKYSNQDKDVN
jgi:hypothetical protein